MRKLLLLLVALLGGLMTLAALAFSRFGAAGLLAVVALVALLVFGVKALFARALPRLFLGPFFAKGAVLRGAGVEVHGVAPIEEPRVAETGEDDEGDEEDGSGIVPRVCYELDVTITPSGEAQTPFALWEPGELMIVPASVPVGTLNPTRDDADDEAAGELLDYSLWQNGRWSGDEGDDTGGDKAEEEAEGGGKQFGPQRVRLVVSLPPDVRAVRLRYYFEVFGPEIALPAGSPPAAV